MGSIVITANADNSTTTLTGDSGAVVSWQMVRESAGHFVGTEKVKEITKKIASSFGLNDEESEELYYEIEDATDQTDLMQIVSQWMF